MTEYEDNELIEDLISLCQLEEYLIIGAERVARRFFILGIIAVFIGFFA